MHGPRLVPPIVLMAGLLAGCQVPHNDTLLFGTQTKLAFDISAAPEQAQIPELTIGYKRKEAVWMPLLANARDSRVVGPPIGPAGASTETRPASLTGEATSTPAALSLAATDAVANSIDQAKYRGTSETDSQPGSDTYSVFASFGAQFEGGGAAAEVEAGGGVAQFFATGIAAQRLARADRVEELVQVKAPSQEQLEAAETRATQAEATLRAALGEEALAAATETGIRNFRVRRAKIDLLMEHLAPDGNLDRERLTNLLDAAEIPPDDGSRQFVEGAADDPADVEARLRLNRPLINPLYEALVDLQASDS